MRSIHKQASKHSLKREARQNEREIAIASKHQAEEHPVENERKYTKEKKRKKEGEREGVMCTHFGTCVHTDKKRTNRQQQAQSMKKRTLEKERTAKQNGGCTRHTFTHKAKQKAKSLRVAFAHKTNT